MTLNVIFLLLAVLATLGLYLAVPTLSWLWLLPILVGAILGVIILCFAVLFIISLFFSTKKPIKRQNPFCRFAIWITMDWLMKISRVRVTVKGKELLPQEPCVLVSNHLSDFDPLTVLAVMPRLKIGYICKDVILRLPLIGPFIYQAGFLPIDRKNGVRAVRTLQRAAELIKGADMSVGIFPEGTRSRTGELLRFKTGAFTLAQEAEVPIVIMVTKGTDLISKRAPFKRTEVALEIIEVISKETVAETPVKELCESVRQKVEEHLKKQA
ncbi:MAG: 1-acyl-sn-glycerol-3-phosphate acyltransferase [Clostridia bacterium]|nr:1-acyl-sn-glycerol-3-phosphate acyltransferase [Clostridia bacterium]